MINVSESAWQTPAKVGWAGLVWLAVGAVGLVLVAALLVGEVGGGRDLAPLDDPARWSFHPDLDRTRSVEPAPGGGVWVGTSAEALVRWGAAGGDYRHHLPEGMAGRPVDALAVAPDGTVWAGTQGQLHKERAVVRFDGDAWTAFTDENSGLPSDRLTSLEVDGDGAVWAATYKGLARFDGEEWTTPDHDDGPPDRVDALAVADDGALWAATRRWDGGGDLTDGEEGGRVARFDGEAWTTWTTEEELPGYAITALDTGADGSVWVASQEHPGDDAAEKRLLRFHDGGWSVEVGDEGLPSGSRANAFRDQFDSFAVGSQGMPWLVVSPRGGADGGVARFDGEAWTTYTRDDGLPANMVASLAAGDDGAVWAGTLEGVGRFADGRWASFVTGEGPAFDPISPVATDDVGVLWVAASDGVSRFDGQDWQTWMTDDGLQRSSANAVAVAPDGTVWVGTDDGVARFDGQEWATWTADDGLGDNQVTSLALGPEGILWVGTDGGVSRFDGRQWATWTAEDGLASSSINAVAVDEDGSVWVGTDDGVSRFDGQEWVSWTADDGLPNNSVNAVAVDKDGAVWAGTSDGIARLDGQQWRHAATEGDPLDLEPGHPLASESIAALTVTEDGILWAGIPAKGLARFDGHQWTTVGDNLTATPSLFMFLAADQHAVWISTDNGLMRFDRSE